MFNVIESFLLVFVDVLKVCIPFYLVFDMVGDLMWK